MAGHGQQIEGIYVEVFIVKSTNTNGGCLLGVVIVFTVRRITQVIRTQWCYDVYASHTSQRSHCGNSLLLIYLGCCSLQTTALSPRHYRFHACRNGEGLNRRHLGKAAQHLQRQGREGLDKGRGDLSMKCLRPISVLCQQGSRTNYSRWQY